MSLKLSPGCTCCPDDSLCSETCGTTAQTEYDVALTGLSNGSNCSICEDIVGTFTLNDARSTTSSNPDWIYGVEAADIPSGATDACVWNYGGFPPGGAECSWYPVPIVGYYCGTSALLRFENLNLVKFKISATDFKWRMIVKYVIQLQCVCCSGGVAPISDTVSYRSGWYWELSKTTTDCNLSASDSWTAVVPAFTFDVNCEDFFCIGDSISETMDWSDFCTGTLSLTSVVNG